MQFGKAMRIMRAIRECSQPALSIQSGISLTYINRAEKGRMNLKREQVERIRMALEWRPEHDHLLDKMEGMRNDR